MKSHQFYKVLAPFGLTPASTMKEIREVGFDLLEQPGGMLQLQRLAWDALRKIETRLVVDFLSWPSLGGQEIESEAD